MNEAADRPGWYFPLPRGQQEGAVALVVRVPADDAAPVVDPKGVHEYQAASLVSL